MSEGLKLSERLRVAIAVNDEVRLPRDMAISVMKAIEVIERTNPQIVAMLAEMEARENRRDDLTFSMMRSVTIFCVSLALIGWAL